MGRFFPPLLSALCRATLGGALCVAIACGDTPPTESSRLFGEVVAEKVSMRIDPLTAAAEIDFLEKGTRVQVIGRGRERVAIGKGRDYWYRVRLADGIEGWVYGANLSVGTASAAASGAPKVDAEELRRNLVGKWWEMRPNGTTGYRRLYIWADGVYKYAYGTGEMREGKYQLQIGDKLESTILRLDAASGMGDAIHIRKIGTELRLHTESEGEKIILRRTFLDPDAPEPGEEDTDASKTGEAAPAAAPAEN